MGRNMYKVWSYSPSDKMCDLICDNYPMLLVLNRFGIDMGFKDDTIGEVCATNEIDVETFLAVVNLLIADGDDRNNDVAIEKISLESLVRYLKSSHSYFVEYKFPIIREKLQEAMCRENDLTQAVIHYFDEYVAEVIRHLNYEEERVFSYGEYRGDEEFNIDSFGENHEGMDSKLTELKNIIIKYYPTQTTNLLSEVLFDIFTMETDLESHTLIEDHLLIPAIKAMRDR